MRTALTSRRPARLLALLTTIALVATMVPFVAVPAAAITVPSEPVTWYVDASADTTGTGTAVDPFRSISSALATVAAGDSIEVAPGVYSEYEEFPLEITGGWYDIYSTDGAEETIIDGAGAPGPLVEAWEAGFSLTGFTITGAMRPELELGSPAPGGGLNIIMCEAYLEDMVITDNQGLEGAGLFIGGSYVEMYDSLITANGAHSEVLEVQGELRAAGQLSDATAFGGGMSAAESQVYLAGCEISDNLADLAGAGVSSWGSWIEFNDCSVTGNAVNLDITIEDNSIDDWTTGGVQSSELGDRLDGGGVYGWDSLLGFWGTDLAENVGVYAAIAAEDSYLTMEDCEVRDHESFATIGVAGDLYDMVPMSASAEGHSASREPKEPSLKGMVDKDMSNLDVDISSEGPDDYAEVYNTLFTGNTCETVWMQYGSALWMENDLIVENTIEYPTIGLDNVFADINYSTLADNGSLWSLWSVGPFADVWATGSIMWDGAQEAPEMSPQAESPAVIWTGALGLYFDDLVSEPATMAVLVSGSDTDAALGFLYDESGVTYEDPRFMDAPNGDYRLALGSPCVDAVTGDVYPSFVDYVYNERPVDGDEDGDAYPDMGAYEYIPGGRLGGEDRYMTAIQIVEQNFDFADTVVIATGERFPDGLAASPLCGLYDAPLLLTPRTYLHPAIVDEIERLGATNVIIVGGTAAVGSTVEATLEGLGLEVDRIGGADRFETAALIAQHVIDNTEFDGQVIIARGDQFADALAVSPVAYANLIPVLLVHPQHLPMSTIEVLYDYGVSSAAVLGSSAAVDTRVEAGIQLDLGVATERIGGDDRYETSALISQWAYDSGLADFNTVGMATGVKFPDALCGGPGIGTRNGVLLLTTPDELSQAADDALVDHWEEIDAVQYFGSTLAISDAVRDRIDEILMTR